MCGCVCVYICMCVHVFCVYYLHFCSIFSNRESASCTHVSAVLHALASVNPTSFNLKPNIHSAGVTDGDEVPVTSLPCLWKAPRKRKQSTIPMSEAVFQKHDYTKPVKRSIKPVEDFDPRPPEFRGTASSRLPDLLQKVKGEHLCVSLLLDSSCCHWEDSTIPAQTSSPSLPDTASLLDTVAAFKSSLKITEDQARHIEQNTREQHNSLLWHSVRRYRITASLFGSVLSRKPNTPPDSLVLRIIQPKLFSTRATAYGIEKEQTAISEYIAYQRSRGHPDIAVSPSGFLVSTTHPFLGASPDGAVFDPSNTLQPFGFLEVKCPYSARMLTPTDACATSGFCCTADPITGQLKLKENHAYYSQVQGQMAIGQRPWCDFVIYTSKGLSVQRIEYNEKFWEDLLHKLSNFYDNCVAPEIVSPVHSLGLPMRNLSKK